VFEAVVSALALALVSSYRRDGAHLAEDAGTDADSRAIGRDNAVTAAP
jgi:hypothetical protein